MSVSTVVLPEPDGLIRNVRLPRSSSSSTSRNCLLARLALPEPVVQAGHAERAIIDLHGLRRAGRSGGGEAKGGERPERRAGDHRAEEHRDRGRRRRRHDEWQPS
jgi:hypothetical protein